MRNWHRIVFVLCILAVGVFSVVPEQFVPGMGLSDNSRHFAAYALITFLGLSACRSLRAAAGVIVGVIVMGGALELAQLYMPSRAGDLTEFWYNCLGVLVGAALMSLRFLPWSPRVVALCRRTKQASPSSKIS